MSSDLLMRIHSPEFQAMSECIADRRGHRLADNVWIGAGATILSGVSIERDSVIAAGAIVADDVPAASLVTGAKAPVRRRW